MNCESSCILQSLTIPVIIVFSEVVSLGCWVVSCIPVGTGAYWTVECLPVRRIAPYACVESVASPFAEWYILQNVFWNYAIAHNSSFEVRVWFRQIEFHCVIVYFFYVFWRSNNLCYECSCLRGQFICHCRLIGEYYIISGELYSIMPCNALSQVNRPSFLIVCDFPACS